MGMRATIAIARMPLSVSSFSTAWLAEAVKAFELGELEEVRS